MSSVSKTSRKEGKTGYTTGTCAAAAAKAAALLLADGTSRPEVEVLLPEGRQARSVT